MDIEKLTSLARRAIDDFQMIDDGDTVAIGLSGGKDSLALLVALKNLQHFYPKKFALEAIMVSLGFPGEDYQKINDFCVAQGVNFHLVQTNIGAIVFEDRKEKNPCSLCSKMRKGALNEKAKALGAKKVAMGHHRDDLVETFFMSLFFEGRIHSFAPKMHWDRIDLQVIRPLLYAREKDIINFIQKVQFPVMKNPCIVDGKTKRAEIKNFIMEQEKIYPAIQDKVFSAITRSQIKGFNE